MAIEWLAISAAVIPHIKRYVADRVEKLGSKYADGALGSIYRRVIPDEKLMKANEAFVSRFSKELDSAMDLATLNARSYEEALKLFLCNPSVQDALQAPLDGESELDWQLLRGTWKEFRTAGGEHLIDLPSDFDWEKLATRYRESIKRQMLSDPELRPVLQALAAISNVETSERTAAAVTRLAGPTRSFDLPLYARSLKIAYAHLKIGSLDTDWPKYDRGMRLESVYVPQSVKQAVPTRDVTRDYLRMLKEENRAHGVETDQEQLRHRNEEYAQSRARPLMHVVDDPARGRLVILGDPGLGKTILLQHLALRWSEDTNRPFTLFIELRNACRESGPVSFLNYLEKGTTRAHPLPRSELDDYLRNHASLILFDGLDEVTEGRRSDAVSAIIHFADDYPKSRAIVTTRIQGYYPGSTHPEQFSDGGFQQFTLQDFDESEIDHFIRRWHEEAFADPDERERYELRLRKALADSPAIRELAANPLLLTLMAILSRNQDLPRERGKLYERCAEMLLRNWDLEKFPELKEMKDTRDIKYKLGPDQKMQILEQVAAAMQQERSGLAGNMIAEDKLKQIVEKELAQLGVPQPWDVADGLIRMLRERNFMLGHLGDRQYAFIHRTFLEYFCARDLKHRLERTTSFTLEALLEVFHERWHQSEWHEVLRLLCGIIGPEYAAKCALALLSHQKETGGYDAVLLAAECLREVRALGLISEARQQVREALVPLTRFDFPYVYDSWEQEQQEASRIRSSAVQELARGWKDDRDTVPFLKSLAVYGEEYSAGQTAVRELARGWRHDPDTLVWLKEHATCDDRHGVPRTAVEALALGWPGDPDVLTLLEECAASERRFSVRFPAVVGLVPGWKDDPGTLPWLKDRAVQDRHQEVRQAAVEAIVRGWKTDPDTLPWLKDRAVQDQDPSVQQAVLRDLARGWKDDPDTLPLIRARAIHADHPNVRSAALEELARGWKEDSLTLTLLRDRAVQDENADVRQAALRELTRGWKGDPETLSLLKGRTISDDHSTVRSAALQEVARGWRDDSTLTLLKDRLVIDDSSEVGRTAVEWVAYGWKDDPDTFTWLKDRAVADGRWEVRQASMRWLLQWRLDPGVLLLMKDRAVSDENPKVREAAIHWIARGWSGGTHVLPWLKERATDDESPDVRQAVLRDVARGWKDDPDTLPWLRERGAQDEHGGVQQAVLEEVTRGWRDDPETLAWLKTYVTHIVKDYPAWRALNDFVRMLKDDPATLAWLKDLVNSKEVRDDIRRDAMGEIVRNWKSDPGTLPWLKDCVIRSDTWAARDAALHAVSLDWKDEPGTLPWLKDRVTHSEHCDVRYSALLLLVIRWKDDPDTAPWLGECALQNDNPKIRISALYQLASGWKHAPETVALLKDRANRDDNPDVRQAAGKSLIEGWTGNPEIEHFLSDLRESRNDEIAAFDELLRCVSNSDELEPRVQAAKALLSKGAVLSSVQRTEEALAVYEEWLRRFGNAGESELRPQIEEALFRKGGALVKLQRNEEAVAVYDEALQRSGSLEPGSREKLAKDMAYPKGSRDVDAVKANPSNVPSRTGRPAC